MDKNIKKTSWIEIFKTPFPYLCFCFLFGLITIARANRGNIEIKIGDQSILLSTQKDQINFEDILKDIEVGSPKEASLLLALKKRDIYKISDGNLVDALEKADFSQEVSRKIRNLWKESKGPFSYQTSMTIVVDENLSGNEAKVCRHSSLANDQRLIIISNSNMAMTTVKVNQTYPFCDANRGENKNNLRVSTDIVKNLKTEGSDLFVPIVKVDALFDNPNNGQNL